MCRTTHYCTNISNILVSYLAKLENQNTRNCANRVKMQGCVTLKCHIFLPKSLWDDIQPIALRDTMANKPEPTKEPIPEKKKKSPMMALCIDLGAAE